MRKDRKNTELRPITFDVNVTKHAEGSCLIKVGDTHVLCTATVEEKVPHFLKGTNQGWVTAEYGMLPRATHTRIDRESVRGKQTGRTQEIQRLIGRSLRAIVDLKKLGERQIKIDCDVLQADGGTRTASISGAYIALYKALQALLERKHIKELPLNNSIAAISCGIINDTILLDLDYNEDSQAAVDANFVLTGKGQIIEIQTTAESSPFDQEKFFEMMEVAHKGIKEVSQKQIRAIMEK